MCSYLLHDKILDTAKDALQFYAEARTQNAKVCSAHMTSSFPDTDTFRNSYQGGI